MTMDLLKLETYKTLADQVITFRMVHKVDDVEKKSLPSDFPPEFTHQIFGEEELIIGYKNLKISFYYCDRSLRRFMKITYDDKLSFESDKIKPDDFVSVFKEKIPPFAPIDTTTNLDTFSKWVTEGPDFKRDHLGEVTKKFELNGNKYVIMLADNKVAKYYDIHERIQTFLLWFIDGASYIDLKDEKWEAFTLWKEQGDDLIFVGFSTVYRFYSYPEGVRPRISQFLILPPHQKQGLGAALLEGVYECLRANPRTRDITVEDPSDRFMYLRDVTDVKMLKGLPSFSKQNVLTGWLPEMEKEAHKSFKLNPKQIRRVFEMLRLGYLGGDEKTPLFQKYVNDVKKRLSIPIIKAAKRKPVATASIVTEEVMDSEVKDLFEIHHSYYKRIASRIFDNVRSHDWEKDHADDMYEDCDDDA